MLEGRGQPSRWNSRFGGSLQELNALNRRVRILGFVSKFSSPTARPDLYTTTRRRVARRAESDARVSPRPPPVSPLHSSVPCVPHVSITQHDIYPYNARVRSYVYEFNTPEGHRPCRAIVSGKLGYDPRDYQVDGVCRALDGVDLLAITPTGSGKTDFLHILEFWIST